MKKPIIIGNWKSNKTQEEAKEWFQKFKSLGTTPDCLLVICPSFTALSVSKSTIAELNLAIKLGAQNISPFEGGAYTGEVSGTMLAELVEFVIIGHSERCTLFHETDDILTKKVEQANKSGLNPIFCIPDERAIIPNTAKIIAYEPISAIGSGQADTPEHANSVGKIIKSMKPDCAFIYGGSVKPENIVSFVKQEFIDGVLPGGASLDPQIFYDLITNAAAAT